MDEMGSSCGEGVGKAGAEVGMVGGYLGGFRARLLQELDWPATGGPLATGIMPREAGAWRPRQVAGDALSRYRVFQEGSAEAQMGSGCRAWVPDQSGWGRARQSPLCTPAPRSTHPPTEESHFLN